MTVTFKSMGNSSEVMITHDRFPDEKTATDHELGWTNCLDTLELMYS